MLKRSIKKSENCLNCGEKLKGENFCPVCGQINNELKPTFWELMTEFFSNLISLDSKLYKTLYPLVFKPGLISKEFSEGKRNFYASPVRMFLLVTFLMLFFGSFEGSKSTDNLAKPKITVDNQEFEGDFSLDSIASSTSVKYNDFPKEDTKEGWSRKTLRMYDLIKRQDTLNIPQALSILKIKNTLFNRFLYTNALKIKDFDSDNYFRYFRSKLVIILLCFIPFIAMVLKLIYIRSKQIYFIDHFIFSVHQLTVYFLILIVSDLLGFFIDSTLFLVLVQLVFLLHMWFAMYRFYAQGKLKTLIKLILLSTGFVVIANIFLFLSGITTFLLM